MDAIPPRESGNVTHDDELLRLLSAVADAAREVDLQHQPRRLTQALTSLALGEAAVVANFLDG